MKLVSLCLLVGLFALVANATDNIRPGGVVLDARAYVSTLFHQNSTLALEQMLPFYEYVAQWWSGWGNPAVLTIIIPGYFADIFRYPWTVDGVTKPFGEFVVDAISFLPNSSISVTTSSNNGSAIVKSNGNICQYSATAGVGVSCSFVMEVANVSFDAGTFYGLGFQYMLSQLVSVNQQMNTLVKPSNEWAGFTIHDLDDIVYMTVTPNVSFVNTVMPISLRISDSSFLLYYGMNTSASIFAYLKQLHNVAHLTVKRLSLESVTLLTAAPATLQAFINDAASNGIAVDLYLSSNYWGLSTVNGYEDAFQTLETAVNFIYSGNQTYPPTSGSVPTMPQTAPTPSSAIATPTPTLPSSSSSTTSDGSSTPAPSSTTSSGSGTFNSGSPSPTTSTTITTTSSPTGGSTTGANPTSTTTTTTTSPNQSSMAVMTNVNITAMMALIVVAFLFMHAH